jgi:RNA polymerase sigma factor (sigma-70 family)
MSHFSRTPIHDHDTDIGGRNDRFPATHHSLIATVASENAFERMRALELIVASYWKPTYKYIRIKFQRSNEDAKDITQDFFSAAIGKQFFASFDSQKASFRTFMRMCIDRFVANEYKAATRLKRGGNAEHLSLDFDAAENELTAGNYPVSTSIDAYFHQEWIRSLFALALDTMQRECELKGKSTQFRVFELYDLEDSGSRTLSYAELATRFNVSASDITNYLAFARREFRRIVLEKLRQLTATDEEFRSEARAILGVEIR